MFAKAVWPVSLKESENQIEGIIDLLQHFSTEQICLLHVKEKENAEAWRKLEKSAETLKEYGFQVETYVRSGHIPTTICDFAREQASDFIILPWKTKMIVHRALLGNNVRDVIRLSNRPVAVYKDSWSSKRRGQQGIKSIMYATAFKATDRVVMPYLKYEGIKADTLYLLNVGERAPDPEAEKKRRELVTENLENIAGECADCYKNIEKIADLGRPYRRILYQARSKGADLVIAGKYDKASPFSAIMGSIAEHLPHRSPCSLLVVPLESLTVTNHRET